MTKHFWGREQAFQANSAKKSNPNIFKTMHRISAKFDRVMWPDEETLWVVLHDDVTIPGWRTAAILNFDFGP